MKKLTEPQAIDIYRRASIGRTALLNARKMSSSVLSIKMGLCKTTINRIGNRERGMKRPFLSRSMDDAELIRAWIDERNEHLALAALHTSSVIAADFGVHKRTVDSIYLGENRPFMRRG